MAKYYHDLPKGLKYELKVLGLISDSTKIKFLSEMSAQGYMKKEIIRKEEPKNLVEKISNIVWSLF